MTLQDINFEYIEKKDGRSKFRCLICKKTYKVLGKHLDIHAEDHKKALEAIHPQENGKTKKLTQEEFVIIKHLLFTGEDEETITQKTGRSHRVISQVKRSDDILAYRAITKKYADHVREKKSLLSSQLSVPMKDKENTTIIWKGELEKLIEQFIKEKAEELQKELQQENEVLKKRLQRLEDFGIKTQLPEEK